MEKKRFFIALFVPAIFLVIIWVIYFFNNFFNLDIVKFGLYPLKSRGLVGILTSSFIHVEFNHIISNTIPFIILGTILFYFYPDVAFKIFVILLIIPNTIVWIIGRPAYHIGCSGIIYGLISYIFFCGVFTKRIALLSISLLVVFLYGSIIWAIFPIDLTLSWESHLSGFITGFILASIFKNKYVYKENLPDWYYKDDDEQIKAEENVEHKK